MAKILFIGDACVSSGFARCTHMICDELHRAGHTVNVLGMHYYGDPHPYPYTIYPCYSPFDAGKDHFGVTRLPTLIERLRPDVVVIQNDTWNIPAYLESIDKQLASDIECPPIVGIIAVDAKNQKGRDLNPTEDRKIGLSHVICWTQFGVDEIIKGGYRGSTSVAPLGVDSSLFKQASSIDKAKYRAKWLPTEPELLPSDAFIIGFVGRNQPRKRLDLLLDYFATWIKRERIDDAYLFLHVAPTGDVGVDLRSLAADYHSIPGKVIVCTPDIGYGIDSADMPEIYNLFDLYATTTQGEGWGLPVLEAMSCGVPTIIPDWSGLGDWASSGSYLVPCTSTCLTAPMNSVLHTVGGVPDKKVFIEGLSLFYRNVDSARAEYSGKGLKLARKLSWENSGQAFRSAIESILIENTNITKHTDSDNDRQADSKKVA